MSGNSQFFLTLCGLCLSAAAIYVAYPEKATLTVSEVNYGPYLQLNEEKDSRDGCIVSSLKCKVNNIGKRRAEEVQVVFPGKGFISISGSGRYEHQIPFDERFTIGNLALGEELTITLWTDRSINPQYEDRIPLIVHSSDIEAVLTEPTRDIFGYLLGLLTGGGLVTIFIPKKKTQS